MTYVASRHIVCGKKIKVQFCSSFYDLVKIAVSYVKSLRYYNEKSKTAFTHYSYKKFYEKNANFASSYRIG